VLRAWCFLCSCRFARTWCYLYDVSCAVIRAQGPGVTCMMFLVQLSVREDLLLRVCCFSCSCPCARTWCYVYDVSRAVVRARGPGVTCMMFLVQLSVREDLVLRVWCFSCSCPCARTWCCVWTKCRRSCPGRWTTCSSNTTSTKTAQRSEMRKVKLKLVFVVIFYWDMKNYFVIHIKLLRFFLLTHLTTISVEND